MLRPRWLALLMGMPLVVLPWATVARAAPPAPVEPDVRTVPWDEIRRFALEAGLFAPVYRPRSEAELARLLGVARDRAGSGDAPALQRGDEAGRLRWWFDRYRDADSGVSWGDPAGDGPVLRLSGRARAGFTDLGNPFDHESGLAWSAGWNSTFEPMMDLRVGRWWAAATLRWSGRLARGGVDLSGADRRDSPLTWPGWSIPTGKSQVRDARLQGDAWTVDLPRVVAGVDLGGWGLSAGWVPRSTGTAVSGAVAMDYTGVGFPSAYLRRTRPFRSDSRVLDLLLPEDLMFTAGSLSERTVQYLDTDGNRQTKSARPWFSQWLVGWEITSWFRATMTHAAMAASRDGTSWDDVFQVVFPTPGVTDAEVTHGPVTDRIFTVQYEVRWRDAPWPILPAAAGRVYIDWGAEDYRNRGPLGLFPRIAAPGSSKGIELLSPTWDLVYEFTELVHSSTLWYSNSGFPEGYSEDGWVLGHALGGSGEAYLGIVRVRPPHWGLETSLRLRHATWGMESVTPGDGRMSTVAVSVARMPQRALHADAGPVRDLPRWELGLEWNRERADPRAWTASPAADAAASRDWWRFWLSVSY